MKIRVEFPVDEFVNQLAELEADGLIGVESIGEVHLPGDWNNWAQSPVKNDGSISPSEETKLLLEGSTYVGVFELVAGAHECKPVIIRSGDHGDGFVSADWLSCPEKGIGQFKKANHGNWRFVVK